MAKPRIYVTRMIPPPAFEELGRLCELEIHQSKETPPSREELLRRVADKDALICLLTDRIDGEVMEAGPNLKVIATYSVGFDHIDLEEATRRGIYVVNTPGTATDSVADFTWALILAASRRLVEADRFVRAGKWSGPWNPYLLVGKGLRGKVLGIIGLGRIGKAVAERAKGFGLKRVIYYDVVRPPKEVEERLGVEYSSLEELLRESDVISINAPLTPETYHMIDEEALKLVKPSAVLVNTGRGPIVDEEALKKALKEGRVYAAGLDVFEREPIPPDDELLGFENVIVTPHIASADEYSRELMSRMVAENVLAALSGRIPEALCNPDVVRVRPPEELKMI
ncbi:MAG: D-glycerate dehydrogenase [Thaumarchaeota archaeon]|nr:D-glycerate dehydrogenase [Nitrososphaerota archaeon]